MEKLSAMVLSKKKELDTKKKNKGFTLVELIIVIAIMVALVAILAPQYIKYVEKSRVSADETNADEILTAVKTAASDTDVKLKAGASYTVEWNKEKITVTDGGDDTTFTSAVVSSLGLTANTGTGATGYKANAPKSATYGSKKYTVTLTVPADSTSNFTVNGVWSNITA